MDSPYPEPLIAGVTEALRNPSPPAVIAHLLRLLRQRETAHMQRLARYLSHLPGCAASGGQCSCGLTEAMGSRR